MNRKIKLKIALKDITPVIWRQVIVSHELTLPELHGVLQGAMEWSDCHLHSFLIDGREYHMPDDEEEIGETDSLDERNYTIGDVLNGVSRFSYYYDFGDNWCHEIDVEESYTDLELHMKAPVCVAGERACPPEDCGGVSGYLEYVDAITNPEHPRHDEMMVWSGPYDPSCFSPSQATHMITAIRTIYQIRG
ncbi:plasmid pRiA4b ORF-3 family protein [uncultured Sneathiella sp.]|jgi:hypothetical protein|uniref:plasmid pRiA4b ORF-3 family protein n=1 Tax=uncultured Sneathiella sp. TaxID=879315 RepID=UPI0030D9A081|tara:strand:+ start:13613 stop:14185 length:573 start_codon:yes stop_codon:yes gene_type:complete